MVWGDTVRALVVEDDRKIASFVKKGLEQAGFAVDHVVSAEEALDMTGAFPGARYTGDIVQEPCAYDVAVVDVMLPGMDGVTLIENLRKKGLMMPVIILSAKRSVDDRIRGLKAGGDDYLTKPFSFSELLVRIHALLRRVNMSRSPVKLEAADLSVDLLTRDVFRAGKKIELQPREFSLLEYFMRNQGHVLSKTLIMEHVWDYHFDPQTNVVDVLVSRLRSKIDRGFDEKLLHTIRGVGYVLKEPQKA
jgi:two-component system OmpR family response regulator